MPDPTASRSDMPSYLSDGEVLWLRSVMREASTGRVVAEQLMEKRWMRSASAIYRP